MGVRIYIAKYRCDLLPLKAVSCCYESEGWNNNLPF